MALIKNCEIHYVKCNPKRPNASFNKKNPTWEVQLRTSSPEQKKEWDAAKLYPKLMVHKEGTVNEEGEDIGGEPIKTEDGKRQYRVNLKKKSLNKEGEKAGPVEVINGAMEPIDPDTIGNGSIANVRIFQYDYKKEGTNEDAVASVLMGIQLKKHIIFAGKPHDDDWEEGETETIAPPPEEGAEEAATTAPKAPPKAPPKPPVKPADDLPEEAF